MAFFYCKPADQTERVNENIYFAKAAEYICRRRASRVRDAMDGSVFNRQWQQRHQLVQHDYATDDTPSYTAPEPEASDNIENATEHVSAKTIGEGDRKRSGEADGIKRQFTKKLKQSSTAAKVRARFLYIMRKMDLPTMLRK